MKTNKISLLLPTRQRPDRLDNLFKSLLNTVSISNRVEIVLYIDDDDFVSRDIKFDGLLVKKIIGRRGTMGYYNSTCLRASVGDIIILLNDDVVFRSFGWDKIVDEIHNSFDDKIYLGFPNDLSGSKRVCTFPIISRTTCELLEQPYPKIYNRYFIDSHLTDIFKRLEYLGLNRSIYRDDLVFEHMHPKFNKSVNDAVYKIGQTQRFDDDNSYIYLGSIRQLAAAKLKEFIITKSAPHRPIIFPDFIENWSYEKKIINLFRATLGSSNTDIRWRLYWFVRLLLRDVFCRIFHSN